MAGEEELSPNAFVEALLPEPDQPPPDTTVLQGLLGPSSKEGYWRLYFSPALTNYAEFKGEDALYREPIPKEQSPLGVEATKVWLKRDAQVLYSQPMYGADMMYGAQPMYGAGMMYGAAQPMYGAAPMYGAGMMYGAAQPMYGAAPMYGAGMMYGAQPMYGAGMMYGAAQPMYMMYGAR